MSFADWKGKHQLCVDNDDDKDNSLEKCMSKLSAFQRQVKLLAKSVMINSSTKVTPTEWRDRLQYVNVLQEEVVRSLAKLPEDNGGSSSLAKKKVFRDFELVQGELRRAENRYAQLREVTSSDGEGGYDDDEEHRMLQFKLVEQDVEHNETLIQEREEEIQKVHQSVLQVNEIFKDLANLVTDQQETIDNIETHIQESHARTEQGLEQVKKASQAQSTCVIS